MLFQIPLAVMVEDIWRFAKSIGKKEEDGSILYDLNGLVQKAPKNQWINLDGYETHYGIRLEDYIVDKNIGVLAHIAAKKAMIKKTEERMRQYDQPQQIISNPTQGDNLDEMDFEDDCNCSICQQIQ